MTETESDKNTAEDNISALAEADASDLAAMAGQISDEDMTAAMSDADTRKRILDEIFGRMADHTDPDKIKDIDAIVHFKIKDAPGGGEDLYEAVIKDGTVTTGQEATTESPKMTIAADPVSFLKLVTGQESGPVLFMKGKVKIQGDLMFATQMTSFFKIPSAA